MVKKYFRPFLCAVCAAMSVILGCGTVGGAYVMASEAVVETKAEESVSEEKQETVLETAAAVVETATDAGKTETASSEAKDLPEETSAGETNSNSETAVGDTGSTEETNASNDTVTSEAEETTGVESEKQEVEVSMPVNDAQAGLEAVDASEGESTSYEEVIKGTGISTENSDTTGDSESAESTNTSENTGNTDNSESTDNAENSESTGDAENKENTENGEVEEGEEDENAVSVYSQPSYDKTMYYVGDGIIVTLSKASNAKAEKIVIVYDIPEGTQFDGISQMPSFGNASTSIQYKDANGSWGDYSSSVAAADVKGLRVTAIAGEDKAGITQENAFVVKLKAEKIGTVESKVATTITVDGKEESSSNTASCAVRGEDVTISMSQTPEDPSKADDIHQTVNVHYNNAVNSRITYKIDPSLTVKTIEVGSNTYLEGGKAIITSASGETEVGITSTMDLQGYVNVTQIVFIPKINAYEGMDAKFTAVMNVNSDVSSVTCTTVVQSGTEALENIYESSYSSSVSYCVVEKPALIHENKQVDFLADFTVGIQGIGVTSYGVSGIYDCTIPLPAFVTLKTLNLPNVEGASKIIVYLGEKSDTEVTETCIGSFNPAASIDLKKKNVEYVRFEIVPENGSFSFVDAGSIVMTNDDEYNTTNYHAFRATAKVVSGEAEYISVSEVLGVTFGIYKRTQVEDNTQSNTPEISQPDTPVTPPKSEVESDTEADTKAEELKAAEDAVKAATVQQMLLNEHEIKEIQTVLLADRISSIRSSYLSSTTKVTEVEAKTKTDPYSEWTVPPINESLVENRVPNSIEPITEFSGV